ncbi:NAD(P)-binding protein [Calocera cornea HHB12733]|uniref:NAD(P)-binding protein n=1 Tax=Calocera cornea HHB12733 TaxID=1353952 RepID=A0A165C7Q3_9BASI|nr:NAD(P)-binding protein [Calocera cornea HHB12733]
MSNKLIVVLGATGTQGSSVVTALLKDGKYAIRAITRNLDSPAAAALRDQGVEVVSANIVDKDSLIKAFDGAYAVFGVTIPYTQDSEELQGRNIVDAAKAAGVPLLVWSSLPGAAESSNGKYTTIAPFDQKRAVDKYIETAGQPTVILHAGSFAENLLSFGLLIPDSASPGHWTITYPMAPESKMGGIWIGGDLGNIVVAVIKHWDDASWRQRLTKEPIVAAPYERSANIMVDTIQKVTGKDVKYVRQTDLPALQKAFFDWADDGFYTFPDQSSMREELGIKTHSFEDYVREVVIPYFQSQE